MADVAMPERSAFATKRAHSEAEATDAMSLDMGAAMKLLKQVLPALRPAQKTSRAAADTLELIMEQWSKDMLKETGEAAYVPQLRKPLSPKQRTKALSAMRSKSGAAMAKVMCLVDDAEPISQDPEENGGGGLPKLLAAGKDAAG